jgi:ABC-type multidrug transport system ATPase subunit
MDVIQIRDAWKRYGNVAALRGISFSVPGNSVYGFLGPNGAGKTTTIRLILGLQRPNRGTVELFGQPLAAHRVAVLRRTGSLVEAPALYSHLTGRENLEVQRRMLAVPKSNIDRVLEMVDLLADGGRLVRGYSQGMRQRLGLAQALLGSPDLLVLDEPTNGLDPGGIHEMRALVRSLPGHGVTVFLSSHLLSEVEQIASHVAIISKGEMQFEGTLDDLRFRRHASVVVEADQTERACSLLAGAGLAPQREGARIFFGPNVQSTPGRVNKMLVEAGIEVSHLSLEQASLEDIFLELTRA